MQATNKGIMEMKLHALLNLTLYRGELQALVCGHFTSEELLKNRHPNIQYGGSELGIYKSRKCVIPVVCVKLGKGM